MADDMGYILTPVRLGMCRLESAFDGTLDLYHFGLMNDAIAVASENDRRFRAWRPRAPRGK